MWVTILISIRYITWITYCQCRALQHIPQSRSSNPQAVIISATLTREIRFQCSITPRTRSSDWSRHAAAAPFESNTQPAISLKHTRGRLMRANRGEEMNILKSINNHNLISCCRVDRSHYLFYVWRHFRTRLHCYLALRAPLMANSDPNRQQQKKMHGGWKHLKRLWVMPTERPVNLVKFQWAVENG